MNRRAFLRSVLALPVAGLPAAAAVGVGVDPAVGESTPTLSLFMMRMHPDHLRHHFTPMHSFVFEKDGFAKALVDPECAQDLVDCHGLDASWEMTEIIVHQIEHGDIWHHQMGNGPFEPLPKRTELTKLERLAIFAIVDDFRYGRVTWAQVRAHCDTGYGESGHLLDLTRYFEFRKALIGENYANKT